MAQNSFADLIACRRNTDAKRLGELYEMQAKLLQQKRLLCCLRRQHRPRDEGQACISMLLLNRLQPVNLAEKRGYHHLKRKAASVRSLQFLSLGSTCLLVTIATWGTHATMACESKKPSSSIARHIISHITKETTMMIVRKCGN